MAVGRGGKKKSGKVFAGTAEDFARQAGAYFAACEDEGRPVLLTGLALALGLADRQSLFACARDAGLAAQATRALLRVEREYELALLSGKATGPVFALKNFGWTDKPAPERTGPLPPGAAECENMALGAAARLAALRREREAEIGGAAGQETESAGQEAGSAGQEAGSAGENGPLPPVAASRRSRRPAGVGR